MKTETTGWVWMRNVLALVGVMIGLAPALLQAGNAAWSTNAASGDWSNGANWNGGNAPGATTGTASPDIAVFSNASLTQITLPDANRNIAGFLFTNATCGIYTNGALGGNKLLLSSGGSIFLAANLASNQYFNCPLELEGAGGAYTFTNASAKSLTFNGDISGVATTGNVTTLTLSGAGGGNFYGNLSDGPSTGKLALVINSGTWAVFASTNAGSRNLMTTTNAVSGGTTLNGGTLRFGSPTTLGTGSLTINGGTLYNGAAVSLSTTNPQYWNASSFTSSFPISSSFDMGMGKVTMSTNVTLTIGSGWGSSLTIRGSIGETGGSRSLTIAGWPNPGYLVLSGSNTFSGGTIINSSGIGFANAAALGTGSLTINGGVIGGSATLNNHSEIWNGNFSMWSANGTLNIGAGPVAMTSNRVIGISNCGLIVGGPISNSGGTNFSLTITAGQYSDTLTLNGTNTFDGGLIMNVAANASVLGANLNIGNLGTTPSASALGTGPLTITVASGGMAAFDNSSGADGTLATSNAMKWSGSFTFTGSHSLNIGSNPVTLNSNVVLTVAQNTLTVGGSISGSNAWYSLTKAGAGQLVLGGANTYTGGTTVTAGRLTVAASGTLGMGNVTVGTNTAVLALLNGNAIAPTATLTLSTNAANCVVALSNSVPDVIAKLIIGGTTNTQPGTYGSTSSSAQFKIATSFTGTGLLKIAAPMGTAVFFR